MNFDVLIPARLASTRLPNKPLADIAGVPMVVHVARQALRSQARRVIVATDAPEVMQACEQHGVEALLTRSNHVSGSDRLAECCALLKLPDDALLVNVQGDEPLIEPSLITAVAQHLAQRPELGMATAAYPIKTVADWLNPNVVKLVLKADDTALYFSRAPIAFWRDGCKPQRLDFDALPSPAPLRHIGIYAYRAGFLQTFSNLSPAPVENTEALEQLRALWHGYSIGVQLAKSEPGKGVDTPEDLEYVRSVILSATPDS